MAVIPARGGSKRLPGKNVNVFLGKPLIHWTIDYVRNLDCVSEVFISTDSDEIIKCCAEIGEYVSEKRPSVLATDTATTVDVVLNVIEQLEAKGKFFEYIALMQPTSPMRVLSRWQEAIQLINETNCSAVVGVSEVENHPYHVFSIDEKSTLTPWYANELLALRSQDLPVGYYVNGSLYLVKTSELKSQKTFFPSNAKAVVCKFPYEAVDIDTKTDWVIGEALGNYFGVTA